MADINRAGVVGLGYVGLPLAVELATSGIVVVGIDTDPLRVQQVNRGESYIDDVDKEKLRSLVEEKRLSATTSFEAITGMDAVSICVPTPLSLTREPDISCILNAVTQVSRYLSKNTLVVLESTTYPGTTEEVVRPILESRGLRCGQDLFLCFSPERVDPANKGFGIKNTPKVIGGSTTVCTCRGVEFYSKVVDRVVPVSTTQVAEMVKLVENTFRAVNIGLANELAIIAGMLGLDIFEVIEAARTKPFGFMPFYPGPGLGGHCIPVDPLYLAWKLRSINHTARFIELADQVNSAMPAHVAGRVVAALNAQRKCVNGSKVLLLGVAYKRNVSDVRESPAFEIIRLLRQQGAEVLMHDPWVETLLIAAGDRLRSEKLTSELVSTVDCVVLATDHSSFDYQWIADHARLIVDTRNAFSRVVSSKATIIGLA